MHNNNKEASTTYKQIQQKQQHKQTSNQNKHTTLNTQNQEHKRAKKGRTMEKGTVTTQYKRNKNKTNINNK